MRMPESFKTQGATLSQGFQSGWAPPTNMFAEFNPVESSEEEEDLDEEEELDELIDEVVETAEILDIVETTLLEDDLLEGTTDLEGDLEGEDEAEDEDEDDEEEGNNGGMMTTEDIMTPRFDGSRNPYTGQYMGR